MRQQVRPQQGEVRGGRVIQCEPVGQLEGRRVLGETLQRIEPLQGQRKGERTLLLKVIDGGDDFLMFELTGQFKHSAFRLKSFLAREVLLEPTIRFRRRRRQLGVGRLFQFHEHSLRLGGTLEVDVFHTEPEISGFMVRFFAADAFEDARGFVVLFQL